MLGETETSEVLEEQGEVKVKCEYCGRVRLFDAVDVSKLFADHVVGSSKTLH